MFIADSFLLNNQDKLRFHVHHHWWKLDLNTPKDSMFGFVKKYWFVSFLNTSILFIDDSVVVRDINKKVDILMITNRTKQHPCEILENVHPKLIVLSSNLDWNTHRYWSTLIKLEGIESHSIKDDGALTINLKEEGSS